MHMMTTKRMVFLKISAPPLLPTLWHGKSRPWAPPRRIHHRSGVSSSRLLRRHHRLHRYHLRFPLCRMHLLAQAVRLASLTCRMTGSIMTNMLLAHKTKRQSLSMQGMVHLRCRLRYQTALDLVRLMTTLSSGSHRRRLFRAASAKIFSLLTCRTLNQPPFHTLRNRTASPLRLWRIQRSHSSSHCPFRHQHRLRCIPMAHLHAQHCSSSMNRILLIRIL